MPRRSLRPLLAINAALLALAAGGLLIGYAKAQPAAARARGNYLMVSGPASGVSGSVVYVADSANQELIALRYQRSSGRVEPIGYRNLSADSTQGSRSR